MAEHPCDAGGGGGELGYAVRQCLRIYGYRPLDGSTDTDIRFIAHTTGGKEWRCQMLVDEEPRFLRLFIFLTDDLYPAEKQSWVVEMAGRLSEEVVLGSIGVQWDSGAVFYRREDDFRGRLVEPEAVGRLLDAAAFPLTLFEHAFGFVAAKHVSPELAVRSALAFHQALDDGKVTDAARRTLLKVVEGSASPSPSLTENTKALTLL